MLFFIVAALYILLIIGISFFYSRKETREDFLIGQRKLSAIPLAISLSTSWMGGGALVIMLYFVINDLPAYLFLALGAVTNVFVFSLFVKKPYELARKNNWTTMTEMVNDTIGNRSAIFVLGFVVILFSVWFLFEIVGSSMILSNITPLSYGHSIALMATVICLYLYFGGFKSLIRTDLLQYGLISFMLFACLYLAKDAPPIDLTSYLSEKPGLSFKGFLAGFFGFFALQFCESTIWQRIFAAKSASHAQKALIYTSGFYILSYAILITLIILGLSHAPELHDERLISFIAYDALPQWLGAFFLVSILAIMMSTLDTVLFIASQCFSTDAAYILKRKIAHPRHSIRLSMVIVTLTIAALALIFRDMEAIFWFVVTLWVCLVPICYMFLPVKTPSDNSVLISMVIMASGVLGLYLTNHYHEHYVAYFFFMGLALPPLLDKALLQRKQQNA